MSVLPSRSSKIPEIYVPNQNHVIYFLWDKTLFLKKMCEENMFGAN